MTAQDTNDTKSHNSSVTRQEVEEQNVLHYLQRQDGATLRSVSDRFGINEPRLRQTLKDLETDGHITVTPRMQSVWIEPLTEEQLSADGGFGTPSADSTADSLQVSSEELFQALANNRRRTLLQCLAIVDRVDSRDYLKVKPFARVVALSEVAWEPTELSQKILNQTDISLIQQQLPKLDCIELLQYYDRPKKLAATEDTAIVASVIRDVQAHCESELCEENCIKYFERGAE